MLSGHLFRAASLLYGTVALGFFIALAVLDRSAFRKPTDKAKSELAAARDRLWNISKPPKGLKHEFQELKTGIKLHYVTAGPASNDAEGTNLVIFLHGFPDSWALWRHFLSSTHLSSISRLVALDLPGYGGSDNLPNYGPKAVLDAVTEFILAMRERYIVPGDGGKRSRGRVLLVAHDWGCTIAFRLASEAPQVADRFIVSNSVHPPLAIENIKNRWASASQMVKTWTHQPRSVRLIRTAASNLQPVLNQLRLSGYVFVFNLPSPIAGNFGSLGDYWFLRLCHAVAAGKKHPLESTEAAEALASSLGPSIEQASGSANAGYPDSVRHRAPNGGWAEKIRLYREGLATKPWEKDLDTLWALSQLEQERGRRRSSSGAGLFEDGPRGALKAPTTVIWGMKDQALNPTIALEGICDYFSKGSQVIRLQNCNHWTPSDSIGAAAFEEVIRWALEGEPDSLKKRMEEHLLGVKVTNEK